MGCGMKPVYVNLIDDIEVISRSNGEKREYIVTPKRQWALGLGLTRFMLGLKIKGLETNGGVKAIWQMSFDGVEWEDGATIITEQTSDTTAIGTQTAVGELTPYCRIKVEVRDTTTTAEIGATLTAWAYYVYH